LFKEETVVRCLILTFVFWLTACSTPQIHIINQGIDEQKVAAVSAELAKLGYEIKISNALVPESFPDVALATNPSITDSAVLTPIENAIEAVGFARPTLFQFAQGNHYYSASHMGVYLRDPNTRLMPPVMGSRHCEVFSATLEFSRNQELIFEYEVQDNNGEPILERTFTGTYKVSGNSLYLNVTPLSDKVFAIQQDKVMTHVGLRRSEYILLSLQELVDLPLVCRIDAVYE
jgi:hypothetical protein